MDLKTGELSGIAGKLLLMTATATHSTIRILKSKFPEVSNWKMKLNLPSRENVTIVVVDPNDISSRFEDTLEPFINRMITMEETYLIIVRSKY